MKFPFLAQQFLETPPLPWSPFCDVTGVLRIQLRIRECPQCCSLFPRAEPRQTTPFQFAVPHLSLAYLPPRQLRSPRAPFFLSDCHSAFPLPDIYPPCSVFLLPLTLHIRLANRTFFSLRCSDFLLLTSIEPRSIDLFPQSFWVFFLGTLAA